MVVVVIMSQQVFHPGLQTQDPGFEQVSTQTLVLLWARLRHCLGPGSGSGHQTGLALWSHTLACNYEEVMSALRGTSE